MFCLVRNVYLSCPGNMEKRILKLTHEIENAVPFTALGFYTVDKQLLVSILSTVITYFIVLLQTFSS